LTTILIYQIYHKYQNTQLLDLLLRLSSTVKYFTTAASLLAFVRIASYKKHLNAASE
jgi:hypothetical protein